MFLAGDEITVLRALTDDVFLVSHSSAIRAALAHQFLGILRGRHRSFLSSAGSLQQLPAICRVNSDIKGPFVGILGWR